MVGRLLSAGNGSDLLRWTYNAAGQVVSETSSFNASAVGYEYDATGVANRLTLDGSPVAQYGVDDAGRLTTITHGSSTFTLAYDNASRRLSLSYPNGIVSGYSYDANSSLLGISSQRAGSPVQQISYTYDTVGNRTTKTIDALQEAYSYDPLSRLTNVARTGATPRRWRFGYDAVGNRVSDQTDGVTLTAAFDPNNQLLSLTPGGKMHLRGEVDEAATVSVAGQPARMTGARTFEAEVDVTPGTNSIPIVSTDGGGNSRTQVYEVEVGGDAATFEYDDNGNTTQKTIGGHTWTYQWNALNQLTAVSKDGEPVAKFKYDPLGRRIEKTAGGLSYRFTYRGQDIVRETQSSGMSYTYIHGPGIDEPLARLDQAGAVAYYHADGLGSIVAMTDAGGNVTARRQYDAWGNLEVGADQPGYAFTGREWDPETGLYYYRARYYDPKIGRFISEDPIGFDGGVNFYAYVGSNPAGYRDPLGLWLVQAAGAVIGGLVNAVGNYEGYSAGRISGGDYAQSIVVGAGLGALATFAPGLAGGALAGGAAAGINDVYNQSIDQEQMRRSGFDLTQSRNAVLVGTATSCLGGLATKAGGRVATYPRVIGGPARGLQTHPWDWSNIGNTAGMAGGVLVDGSIPLSSHESRR